MIQTTLPESRRDISTHGDVRCDLFLPPGSLSIYAPYDYLEITGDWLRRVAGGCLLTMQRPGEPATDHDRDTSSRIVYDDEVPTSRHQTAFLSRGRYLELRMNRAEYLGRGYKASQAGSCEMCFSFPAITPKLQKAYSLSNVCENVSAKDVTYMHSHSQLRHPDITMVIVTSISSWRR